MDEYRSRSENEQNKMPEKIDLTNIMIDVFHGIKKLWWLILVLAVVCAVQSYFSVS